MKQVVLILLIAGLNACLPKSERPSIYLNHCTAQFVDDRTQRKDSLYTLTSEYFNIEYHGYSGSEKGMAVKYLKKMESRPPYESIELTVSDSLGNRLEFSGSTDFLNFMSARGYSLEDQQKERKHINYTFKRSP